MRLLTILLTALTLSACASSNRVPLPDWTEARQSWNEVHDGEDLPLLCEIPWTTADCWLAIEDYEDTVEENRELAILNASALRKVIEAYDNAISGGEMQQEVSEMYREELDRERSEHFWTKTGYRIVLGGVVIALAL